MKKNFLITTGIIDTWEFSENNFLLGKWCEFYEFNNFDKNKIEINNKNISIFKNTYHWDDNEKKEKDYKYLTDITEYLLEEISKKLSLIHEMNESKDYWRIIISNWLNEYTTAIFDRWENIRIFFENNKNKKFYSNFISLSDLDFIPKNHKTYSKYSQKDEWNHLVYLRILDFLKIYDLTLVKKTNIKKREEEKNLFINKKISLISKIAVAVDRIISNFAFKFNKIIFISFYFPSKKEYLKICAKFKLIPSKYSNFFDFNIEENKFIKDKKRAKLKDLLSQIKKQDKFVSFLLINLYRDMPMSYLENFKTIKKKIQPLASKKKTIFSMHSIIYDDNFKIYIAETKKFGSKYIYSVHGGGLAFKMDPRFNFFEKISDKIIKWDNTINKNIFSNLSPTLPTIGIKNLKNGKNCSIMFWEYPRYTIKFITGPSLEQTTNLFDEVTNFVNKLSPQIQSKVKFRTKTNFGYNSEKRFSKLFGKAKIDSGEFRKTILNSKLIVTTYGQTVFSESMNSNTPTILIIKKENCFFSKSALSSFDELKKNKIAFEDFNEARIHINKYWDNINLWWESADVQSSRKKYLRNFFNVKSNWYKEWSDYISYSQSS